MSAVLRLAIASPMRKWLSNIGPGPAMLVLSWAAYLTLRTEVGGGDIAVVDLIRATATRLGQPIGVHLGSNSGGRTALIAPSGWTRERLLGYMAGRHQELEAAFGRVAAIESKL